jgi:hypothetical protein
MARPKRLTGGPGHSCHCAATPQHRQEILLLQGGARCGLAEPGGVSGFGVGATGQSMRVMAVAAFRIFPGEGGGTVALF